MQEIKKAMTEGVTERPEVGIVGRRMTSTDKAVMLLVLVLGARQNLRNDDNIVITTDDVYGYCTLSAVDECVFGLIEYFGYIDFEFFPIIDYYEYSDSAIYIQSPYLHELYHYIARLRNVEAPYADLADVLSDTLNNIIKEGRNYGKDY